MLLSDPALSDVAAAQQAVASGRVIVAMQPREGFCASFGVQAARARPIHVPLGAAGPCQDPGCTPCATRDAAHAVSRFRLRTLHPYSTFDGPVGHAIVEAHDRAAVWRWLQYGTGGMLMIGTDLAGDIIRYRQGNPQKTSEGQQGHRWGYAGERPNYLFEEQRGDEPRYARHADEWIVFLSRFLASCMRREEPALLPYDAPGAIILTGDDDVAERSAYAAQLELIGDHPITYFIHKDTRHDAASLRALAGKPSVHIGFHPDALDAPDQYADRFAAQARWLKGISGIEVESVRNHGFLNDGYWGHLPVWLHHRMAMSSNLPGVDGTVLNGSLLPGRVAYDGVLTDHWSILTAIGDGAVFINNWDETQAARCIYDAADAVASRGIPGVLVLNLHPANIERTRAMHLATLEVIRSGFIAWNLRDCLDWFRLRETQ
jgi:hypothetical protein